MENNQKIWQLLAKIDYKLPFETPIPVGTRSRKIKKNDIKDYNIAIFTKKARILKNY
nr:hypothetical protein [Mycoplasmopsis bovis]